MPHRQRHRGRHPSDDLLFGASQLPALRSAVYDLSWLRSRGYAETAALKLVGDRYVLRERQRRAVARATCTDDERASRASRRKTGGDLDKSLVALDGFNCLITVEAALSGGLVLVGRDGSHRDLASVHGSYRRVSKTDEAIAAIANTLADLGTGAAHWYLDRPIANSGALALRLRETARQHGWPWTVELATSPDREILAHGAAVAASSDGWILDRCSSWLDLPGEVIDRRIPDAWILDLEV